MEFQQWPPQTISYGGPIPIVQVPPPYFQEPVLMPYADVLPVETYLLEEDYTFWRYSKFALPFLLVLLAIYTMLLGLTAWQSHSDIRYLYNGQPRNLQPPSSSTSRVGGIPNYKISLRFATSTCAILFSLLTLLVFFMGLKPVTASAANYPLAFLLFCASACAFVAFGLDVNSEKDARRCTNNLASTRFCVSREDMLTAVDVWEAGVAVFGLLSAILVFFYTASGDWTREREGWEEAMEENKQDILPGSTSNGVASVRKTITVLALLATLIFAIMLLVFTIINVQDRDTFVSRDQYNRKIDPTSPSVISTNPGWPAKNSKLRYAVSALVILTVLFNLIPFTSRVIAYCLAFLYFAYACLSFVVFALDVNEISNAKSLVCPTYLTCNYAEYQASAAIDFIGGVVLLIYVVAEYVLFRSVAESPMHTD